MPLTEADTCRKLVAPKLQAVGLDEEPHAIAEHGDTQFVLPDVLHIPPVSQHGTVSDIIKLFGGDPALKGLVRQN